jgi:TonB family protein
LVTREVYAQSQSAELAEASELEKTVVKLYGEGKYQEALPLAKRVLQIREQVPNLDIQFVRSALVNLAELYLAMGKYGDAESSFERVITSYRNVNPNDVRLADTLERIALVHFARNNQSKAEAAYQESLRLKETVLGPENPRTMKSVLELAEFYQFSGEFAKAVPHYQRLLTYREKSKGPRHKEELAEVVDRYSCALRKLNKIEDANNIEKRLLDSPAGTGVSNQPETVDGVLNGRAVSMPRPTYPAQARAARASGTVIVRVLVDEKGSVIRACAIKGHQLLTHTSELAAYGAKFTPTLLSGMPVKVMGIITYNYVQQ